MHLPAIPRIPLLTQNVFIGRAQDFEPDPRPGHRTVSMITQRQIRPGCQEAFVRALWEFVAFAQKFPGHLGLRVLTRIKGGREIFAVVDHFVNSAARCAFTSSPEFGVWLAALRATTLDIPNLREAETTQAAYPAEREVGSGRTTDPSNPTRVLPWIRDLMTRSAQTVRRLKLWLLSRC